jgi:hypothetical protein
MDEDEKVNSTPNLPHVMGRILQYWSETEENTHKSEHTGRCYVLARNTNIFIK